MPMADGSRHINLTIQEREQLARNRLIEAAVALFLDLEADRTWQQIADTLGINLAELKRLTKDPDFIRVHEESLVQIGHDPRLRTVVAQLSDLLPTAFQTVKALMAPGVQDQTRLKAALEVMRLNRVEDSAGGEDPRELRSFLQRQGVVVQGDFNFLKLNIPTEYANAFQKYFSEVVDGESRDIPVSESDTQDNMVPEPGQPGETSTQAGGLVGEAISPDDGPSGELVSCEAL